MMKRILIALGAAALLAACETPTPYQPLSAPSQQAAGGYSELQIEPNRWRVQFAGNSLTSRETVERYLLFRAAQLTIAQGDDWFQSVGQHTDKTTDYQGDAFGPYWGLYRPGFGWAYGYWGGGPWGWGGAGSFDLTAVTQYTASVEIIIGRGAKPADPRAYDAHAVVDHLQATIVYPRPAK